MNRQVGPHRETLGGPEATARFDPLVRKMLSVPNGEIMRREAEYKRQSAVNPQFQLITDVYRRANCPSSGSAQQYQGSVR
jgi:hypothetical protein